MIHWFQCFSNYSIPFFCGTICRCTQNTPQFPISLLYCSQISFPVAFFWGLQTASCHWGPDLENRVGAEAIRSAIYAVLRSMRSTCDRVHCLGERALFSSLFMAVFWRFLQLNAIIMLHNIRYWWFFLSPGNRWTKYLAHPKIRGPKPWLLMFASLVALDSFHLLLSTQLTADLIPGWSGRSMFYPLSHIYAKTPFLLRWNSCKQRSVSSTRCCFWSTVSKLGTHFFIDKCSCKTMNTLPSDIFNSSAILHNFNWRSAKTSLWSFFCVFWENCRILVTWAFSIIFVCMASFKASIPPLFPTEQSPNNTYESIVLLEQYFSHQKAMLYQHT